MLYDAILNGARSMPSTAATIRIAGRDDSSWLELSFWSSALKPLLGEINSLSPLAPALVNPATTQTLLANDATTQAISRHGIPAISRSQLATARARHM
jgi:hypothetical protein